MSLSLRGVGSRKAPVRNKLQSVRPGIISQQEEEWALGTWENGKTLEVKLSLIKSLRTYRKKIHVG